MKSTASALLQTYAKYPIQIVKGKGSYVWDKNGKKYLDFYGGHAVCLLGHCPEKVVQAIKEQSSKLMFYSNIFDTEPAETLAKKLVKTLKPQEYQVFLTNSGSEANETALKIARKYTGKKHVIAFENSFHGRSISAMGVTGIKSYHQFNPNLDKHTSFATLGDIESVRKAWETNTAAIICEPIQSIGGVNMAGKIFYKDLEKFCREKGILLIFDEVQTGLGRTGTFWFAESVGVHPDIITTAKGIASGLPLSAVMIEKKVADTIKVGEHATTFGGGPVVCAAANATLKILESLIPQVSEKEQYIRKKLKANPNVEKVFGQGLLLGIKLKKEAPDFIKKCMENGLIIGSSMKKDVMRIMPPLDITKKDIDLFAKIFNANDLQENIKSETKTYYFSKFSDQTFVVKIGGEVIQSKKILENILKDIKKLNFHGIKIILVHGGGKQADELAQKLGYTPQKHNGRRITSEKDLEIAKMLYGGSLNLEILSIMKKLGMKGMRVSGMDGNLLDVKKRNHKDIDFGYVGDIKKVNPHILRELLKHHCIPVVSPLAAIEDGTVLNINADTIATEIAIKMHAEKLILFTNTNGVYKGDVLLRTLTIEEAKDSLEKKIVKDGMAVKVENCIHAVEKGVKRVHIVNGLSAHSLLGEILTKKGVGTMFVSKKEAEQYLQEAQDSLKTVVSSRKNMQKKIPYTWHFQGEKKGKTVVIIGALHGNERLGAKIIETLREELLDEKIHGEIWLIVGNPKAYEADKRYLDCDLNRLFGANFEELEKKMHAKNGLKKEEEKRAVEIAPILKKADFLLDIHSTSKPSAPFVFCKNSEKHLRMTAPLQKQYIVSPKHNFTPQNLISSADNFVDRHGGIGFTYETGWNKDKNVFNDILQSARYFLKSTDVAYHSLKLPTTKLYPHYIIDAEIMPKTDQFKFEKDFANFDAIKKGEKIAQDGEVPIRAKKDAYIIFPNATPKKNIPAAYLAKDMLQNKISLRENCSRKHVF